MDTLPLRQAKPPNPYSQRLPFHKVGQCQTTIDLYLKSISTVKQSKNDIRNYFPPVAKVEVFPNGEVIRSSSPAKMPVGAARYQTLDAGTSVMSPAESMTCISKNRKSGKRAGVYVRTPHHNHVKSAVLPKFDPFFDSDEFPHSISPMAPRVTDVVRHSLVPKPLNIKVPPPTADASRSPSQTTSSPSSVGDLDSTSFDGERREAPSFKQTYMSVHSRQNTNDSPINPLTAWGDPCPKPLRQRMDRPATLRSKNAPQLSAPYSTDSVIYFLPKISPTSDSSADEREPVTRTKQPKWTDKASIQNSFKAKKPVAKFEKSSPTKIDTRKEALKDGAVAISSGRQTPSAVTPETWC